jgi:adenylate cyclase
MTAPHAISLRFVVFAILLGNLIWAEPGAAASTNIVVVWAYLVVSVISLYAERLVPRRALGRIGFTVIDALLTALVLYAHVLGGPVNESHSLTTTSLVVAFILLNHVGLKGDGH